MPKTRKTTAFVCEDCGADFVKWQGQCPACKAWNTLKEFNVTSAPVRGEGGGFGVVRKPVRLSEISAAEEPRFMTGLDELDRVLGGGAVVGSVTLLSGEPGIGKSTLLLQICDSLAKFATVLYVSGEESEQQIKLRAERLNVGRENLYILSETDVAAVERAAGTLNPGIVITDSVQTMFSPNHDGSPGSVGQVRECVMSLTRMAKTRGITVFLIGHVNKEGSIAGPKTLEHIVDCVLYFEGDRQTQYRILRAEKNRFGSTHETGMFEMLDEGLREVPDPSETLLSGRPAGAAGTCVFCSAEGSRPLLTEIQALCATTAYNYPSRRASGMDAGRVLMLLAILEKRSGRRFNLGASDVYVNVVGGFTLTETAADLPAALCLASSLTDKPIPGDTAAFGELGLSGEIRGCPSTARRLSEAARLGFKRVIMPHHGTSGVIPPEGLEIVRVKNLGDALRIIL